jgi:hypothetical protein
MAKGKEVQKQSMSVGIDVEDTFVCHSRRQENTWFGSLKLVRGTICGTASEVGRPISDVSYHVSVNISCSLSTNSKARDNCEIRYCTELVMWLRDTT